MDGTRAMEVGGGGILRLLLKVFKRERGVVGGGFVIERGGVVERERVL